MNIETILNKEFSSLCEWFIDNKLSIHFGKDKTKPILFTRSKTPAKLFLFKTILLSNIIVEYLGCFPDYNLKWETMAQKVLRLMANLIFLHSWTLHIKDYFEMQWFNPTLTMVVHHGTCCLVKCLKKSFR